MRLGLVFSEVGQGLRRNLSMVVAVILVTFISLTFVGAAMLMQLQIQQMKGYWNDRAQVAVYLCSAIDTGGNCAGQQATEEQVAAVRATLEGPTLADFVQSFEFDDLDAAFAKFQEQFAGTEVAQLVTPEILQQTFWISLSDPDQSEVIADALTNAPGVQEVKDQREYLDPIFGALNAASYTAVGIAALMLVAAVMLIATTIRLSAFSRRRELGIMRLVGASNRFIQTPFVIEGVISSLVGSVLASAAIVVVVKVFVEGYLTEQLTSSGFAFVTIDDALLVVPVLVAIGAALAGLSASFAIRRYLRV